VAGEEVAGVLGQQPELGLARGELGARRDLGRHVGDGAHHIGGLVTVGDGAHVDPHPARTSAGPVQLDLDRLGPAAGLQRPVGPVEQMAAGGGHPLRPDRDVELA
jgi:hypothetical protein